MKENIQIGKLYHFWDDGKSAVSRHYICKCENIITLEPNQEFTAEYSVEFFEV